MVPRSVAKSLSRRAFFKTGAVASAMTIVPRHVLGGKGFVPPSDSVNVAVIGTGGQGLTNIRSLYELPDVQVVAIADPNEESDYSRFYYGGTAGRRPALALLGELNRARNATIRVAEYLDYRLLLEKEKSIDAVLIATPDHVHAVATLAALSLGKPVYCEKPLTHSIAEARRVAVAAINSGIPTQMGNQGHSGEGIRQTCEWIWAGAIGKIREVNAWTGANGWASPDDKLETPRVPSTFDWNLWLGPVAYRDYSPAYAPYNWRGWWAFGTGGIGDMACHNLDPAFWALKLGHPVSVEAIDTPVHPEIVPANSTVRYEFPAREGMPPVTVTWYDGDRRPPKPEGMPPQEELDGNGIIFVGEKGAIVCPGWGGPPKLYPDSLARSFQPPSPTLPRSRGHHRDWVDACKGGRLPSSNFGIAGPMVEVVLLGNIAQRIPGKLAWDGEAMKVRNHPEADAWIDPPCRAGWSV